MIKISVSEKHKNIKIIDSYFFDNKHFQIEVLQQLLEDYPWFRGRSLKSYLREWRCHNRLYKLGIKPESTKDCDLNVDESLIRRIVYFFLGF